MIETRVTKRDLSELKPSELNARKMTAAQLDRLVKNIEADGGLTSIPLIYQDRIISGHHRIEASIKAGIETADCMEITSEVSEEHLTAIQLSHNSITGDDDTAILRQMLEKLGALEQEYSAVVPPDPEMIDLGRSIRFPPMVQVMVEFLPAEYESIEAYVEKVEGMKDKKYQVLRQIESAEAIDKFLEVFFKVKGHVSETGTLSTPCALIEMADLAGQRLDQIKTTDTALADEVVPTPPS